MWRIKIFSLCISIPTISQEQMVKESLLWCQYICKKKISNGFIESLYINIYRTVVADEKKLSNFARILVQNVYKLHSSYTTIDYVLLKFLFPIIYDERLSRFVF